VWIYTFVYTLVFESFRDDKDASRFVSFFMANAESSLRTALVLQQISDEARSFVGLMFK
jgi:hypothetical protein